MAEDRFWVPATESVRRLQSSAVRRQLMFNRSFIDLAHRRQNPQGSISQSSIDDATPDVTSSTGKQAADSRTTSPAHSPLACNR